jgi:protein-S-isoprenylcysteine O-methyltransferase Ste14
MSALAWGYALVVAVAFHLRVLFYEEPRLRSAFADEWTVYEAAVPTWIGFRRAEEAT